MEFAVNIIPSLFGVEVNGKGNFTEENKSFTEDIRIKYYGGDIDIPTTYKVMGESNRITNSNRKTAYLDYVGVPK